MDYTERRESQLGASIRENIDMLKEKILAQDPSLLRDYDHKSIEKCKEDIGYHLMYLAEALTMENRLLFEEYMSWVKVLFEEKDISIEKTKAYLEMSIEVLAEFTPSAREIITPYIEGGLRRLSQSSSEPTFIKDENPYSQLAESYLTSLLHEDRRKSLDLILSSVKRGVPIKDIYVHVFQPVLQKIGYLWQKGRISVAREHYCTATTQHIMSQLYPWILNPSSEEDLRCITLCVSGELHELGIRMIADLLEMDGWDTTHLGANTPLEGVIEMVEKKRIHLLAISATITFHLDKVREIITRVKEASLPVKIMVGGYPFNTSRDLWKRVGAHAYAPDAISAVEEARRVVEEDLD